MMNEKFRNVWGIV